MASIISSASQVKSSIHERPSGSHSIHHFKTALTSSFQPLLRELGQYPLQIQDISTKLKKTSIELLNTFADLTFEFVDQPRRPSQNNFAPVEEIGNSVLVKCVEGEIPDDFPKGIYARNGSNPLFGGLKSSFSMFGRSNHIWVEGEGMIHAMYFNKESNGSWSISYKNKYIQSETFKHESQRTKPSFLLTVEGDSRAILSAYLLNMLRFGRVNKVLSNTNIFEHGGKFYSISEVDLPQEIDIHSLETFGTWDINGAWDRPFVSHPKKAPYTGELVIVGVDAKKPFNVLGVISADGTKLIHKLDLNYDKCTFSHEVGVTQRYNVILDFPLTIDINRVIKGGPLIKFVQEEKARIGVMPRFGDLESLKWFNVETSNAFHIFNSFEDCHEVVIWGCRSRGSIIPGPELGNERDDYFARGFKRINNSDTEITKSQGFFFTRVYEWRLNMQNGEVKEKNLTGTYYSMDFPMINEKFTGVKNKFGYTQVVDLDASSFASMPKYGGLAKVYFEELSADKDNEDMIKVEYHNFPKNTYCTGSTFLPKIGGIEEDDGFIITYVHDETNNISQVYIIDAKRFTEVPVAIITLPTRVPYGFHGLFIPTPLTTAKAF